jgi:PIN domain nuclease of toxin-antitoxin system
VEAAARGGELRLLLDTQAVLWSFLDKSRLSPTASEAIAAEANDVFVSVVSVWEIEIKRAKRKLHVPFDLEAELAAERFEPLLVTMPHARAVEALPRHHRDPFDRMLIAQATLEGMALVTSDRLLRRYPVATLPAS